MAHIFDAKSGPPVGMLAMHLMTNCVIEVAGDGKTAKGVWSASGMVAGSDPKTHAPNAMWEWNRYGIDFVKEDGKWRFWHHHIFPWFQIGWDEKWSDRFGKKEAKPAGVMPLKTDGPPGPLDISYSPDGNLPYIPEPQPYETFDPKTMY